MRVHISIHAVLLSVLLGAALSTPWPASAQITRADSAAVVLAVASDFDSRGESDMAISLYQHIVDRFPNTPASGIARARLDAAMLEVAQAGGEIELKVWGTLYGIWLGMAVPAALEADGPEPYGVGLLLGAPVGFLGARAMTRSRPVSLGQARTITWGGTWGAIQGLGWANALDLGGGERTIEGDIMVSDGPSQQAVFTSMIAGGALGLAGGALAARRDITPGTATSAMLGSLWGSWFGLASSILADLSEDEAWGTVMVTGSAGLVGGALAGSRWPLSRSRARLISVGGLMGGVGGFGLLLITDSDDDDAIAVPLVTSILGLVAGAVLTEGDGGEEDPSEGLQAAGSLAAPGALLNLSRGEWSFSAPLPSPVWEPALRADGRDGLAWRVPLLNARF